MPRCIKIFTWLLLQNRLWTCDRLQRCGWPNNYFCPLCVRNLETMHHLIWSCPLAREVWERVAARRGCQQFHPRQQVQEESVIATLQRMAASTQPAQRRASNATMLLTCWELWQERNRCVFKGKIPLVQDIVQAIEHSIELWRQAGATHLERPFWDPP